SVSGEHGVVAIRQTADKSIGVGQSGRLDALLIGGIQLSVSDIVHDRSGEQVGILQHHSQGPAQIRLLDLVDIDTVVADFSVGDIIEPVDQIGDGGLSGTGGAYES